MSAGKIFISYRREDSGWAASNIYGDLTRHFGGKSKVFMDVDSIPVGADFVLYLQEQVDRCDTLVALIGGNWVTPRLVDRRDFVRVEIERALDGGKAVVPVLLDDARMPSETEIPLSLAGLLNRNAVRVRRESYRLDLPNLVASLRSVAATRRTSRVRLWMQDWLRPTGPGTVEATFSGRVHPDLLEVLLRDARRLQVAPPEIRMLTIMQCNVLGVTRMAEEMAAAALIEYLNDLMTPFTDAVLRWRGTVDKYLGDTLLAFWNAPLDDRAPEANACAAALEMRDVAARLNQQAAERGSPAIRVATALVTGPCAVGPMGTRRRFDYSCFGETVNLSGRLAGLTGMYGVSRLIDEATAQAVTGYLAVLEIDKVIVRGRPEPLKVFALLGDNSLRSSPDFRAFADRYEAGRAAYLAQDWAGAERELTAAASSRVVGLDTTPLCEGFRYRIETLRKSPPERDWDGVFRYEGTLTK
jgi:class 3 adenylate cyclase